MDTIKLGDLYYDEANGRWLTVVGLSRDVVMCDVEELNEECEPDYVDTLLFTRVEISHYKKEVDYN